MHFLGSWLPFRECRTAQRRTGSYDDVRRFCRENFLSHPTLEMLDSLREQFRQQLAEVGFTTAAVPSRRAPGRDAAAAMAGGDSGGSRGIGFARDQYGEAPSERDPDRNAGNIALVQSALCAGLYPNVAAFVRPDPRRQVCVYVFGMCHRLRFACLSTAVLPR